MTEHQCPIWQTRARVEQSDNGAQVIYSARAGGCYLIKNETQDPFSTWAVDRKIALTNWLVEQRRLGIKCPDLSDIDQSEETKQRSLSVHQRADNLLRYLRAKSDLLGTTKVFCQFGRSADSSQRVETLHELLAWTASQDIAEIITLAEYCGEERWISYHRSNPSSTDGMVFHELMLRPPGYSRLAALDGINTGSRQAFVAMWFDDSMKAAYEEGIAPAIREAGYEPMRIDRKHHNNKIDDEIIAEIRRSRFLVADFTQGRTGARGGVYYEAGFAHGLNLPVMFTCRADAIKKVHFDTRQYNHITWKNPEELKERLAKRISATLGDGPLKRLA